MSATITVNDNGPLKVEGDFQVTDGQGNTYNLSGKPAVFLCRCGLSNNKPFCDGKHKNGFESKCLAPNPGAQA